MIGQKGTLYASFDGDDKWGTYTTVLREVNHEEYFLNWGGGLGCLFMANHWIQLTKTSESETHMDHFEDFSGPFPAMGIGMPFKKVARNYDLINQALKEKVEAK